MCLACQATLSCPVLQSKEAMETGSEDEPAKFYVQIESIRHIVLIIEKFPIPNPRHVRPIFHGERTDMKGGGVGWGEE